MLRSKKSALGYPSALFSCPFLNASSKCICEGTFLLCLLFGSGVPQERYFATKELDKANGYYAYWRRLCYCANSPNDLKLGKIVLASRSAGERVRRTRVIEWNKYRNPYSAGNPVKSEKMFFGRDEIFERAYAHLHAARNPSHPIVIYGQRRMGKTSVLHHMQRRLNALAGQERYATVLLDLQGFRLRSNDNFWKDMLGYMHLKLKRNYQLPKPDLPLFEGEYKLYFMNSFLPMVQSAIGERRLVLMFDESLRLSEVVAEKRLSKSIFDDLRQLMHNDFISFIYSLAAPVSTLQPEFKEMLKDALTLHVTYFPEKVARALVTEPVAEFYQLSDTAIGHLLSLTGSQPYFTQAFCESFFFQWKRQPFKQATSADILAVRDKAIDSTMNNLLYLWIEPTVAEKLVLAAIAGMKPGPDIRALERRLKEECIYLNKEHIKRALKGLHQREIIDSPIYPRIHLGMLRDWLRYAKNLRSVRGTFHEYLPPVPTGGQSQISPALTVGLTKPWVREPARVSLGSLAGLNR